MKRLSITALLLVIAVALFATGQSEDAGDQGEQVEIYMKAMGNPPDGLPAVVEELNEMLREDLNATIRIEHYTWSDWQNKYRLDLVSGEPIDVLYTATWANFPEYASDGAFVDVAPLLPEVAPDLWAQMPNDRWAAATAPGGEIFAVPSMDFRPNVQGTIYREDLRRKHGLEPIETLEDLEALMYAVAENEPEMRGLGNEVLTMWTNRIYPYQAPWINMLLYVDRRNPKAPLNTPLDLREDLIESATIIRGYYDDGLFSHDVLANVDSPRAAEADFDVGLIPVSSRNEEGYVQKKLELQVSNPDWELGFLPNYWSERGDLPRYKGVFQDATAFPIAGNNTERGLQFLELALLAPDYHTLLNYGVEGEHYNRVDSQTVQIPADTTYADLGMWGLRNSSLFFDRVGDEAGPLLDEIISDAEGYVVPDHARSFIVYDMTPVQSTLAALRVVVDEMFIPLKVGLYPVEEIPQRVDEYLEALEDAGIRQVQEYVQTYWEQYTSRL
ncbi:MAG: extracellular solute-binding protein [Spirochaetales bacterium]